MKIDREVLKADGWETWDVADSDQGKGCDFPSIQKPTPPDAVLVDLPPVDTFAKDFGGVSLYEAISGRKSRRKFSGEALSLKELSWLLWATQGITKTLKNNLACRRMVPSGGSRHPFETYLFINHVDGLKSGLYRYLGLEHKLLFLYTRENLVNEVHEAFNKQFILDCSVAFMWTAIPYRTEWRYTFLSPKIIAQDSGHLCQNLYLACEAIQAGTCAIGAYDQKKMDAVLQVDREEEFAIYCAPVGKLKQEA